jgi:hypothetical protein
LLVVGDAQRGPIVGPIREAGSQPVEADVTGDDRSIDGGRAGVAQDVEFSLVVQRDGRGDDAAAVGQQVVIQTCGRDGGGAAFAAVAAGAGCAGSVRQDEQWAVDLLDVPVTRAEYQVPSVVPRLTPGQDDSAASADEVVESVPGLALVGHGEYDLDAVVTVEQGQKIE